MEINDRIWKRYYASFWRGFQKSVSKERDRIMIELDALLEVCGLGRCGSCYDTRLLTEKIEQECEDEALRAAALSKVQRLEAIREEYATVHAAFHSLRQTQQGDENDDSRN